MSFQTKTRNQLPFELLTHCIYTVLVTWIRGSICTVDADVDRRLWICCSGGKMRLCRRSSHTWSCWCNFTNSHLECSLKGYSMLSTTQPLKSTCVVSSVVMEELPAKLTGPSLKTLSNETACYKQLVRTLKVVGIHQADWVDWKTVPSCFMKIVGSRVLEFDPYNVLKVGISRPSPLQSFLNVSLTSSPVYERAILKALACFK